MKTHLCLLSVLFAAMMMASCGPKKPAKTVAEEEGGGAGEEDEKAEKVAAARDRIQQWFGEDLAETIKTLSKDVGMTLGEQLAGDGEVTSKAKSLSTSVLHDSQIKGMTRKISDKATAGLGNKLTLGWKAIKAGGVEAYKRKISGRTTKIAVDVLTNYMRESILKDRRFSVILKDFGPALKMQSMVAALAIQENMSPRVTQKILSIALRIAGDSNKSEMAGKVENWVGSCRDQTHYEVEKLFREISGLQSVKVAVRGLAIEVLGHETTKREVIEMTRALLENRDVHNSLIKVYEAAAFEHGDNVVRGRLEETLNLPMVNDEIFATMGRLAEAKGAQSLIGRYFAVIGEDYRVAELVENFVMSLLEACGDPISERH